MFNVGGPEVLVILLVALIALGPAQLPEAARKVGKAMNEVRKVSTSFQRELTNAFDLEQDQTQKPKSPGGPTDLNAPAEDDDVDRGLDDLDDDLDDLEPLDDLDDPVDDLEPVDEPTEP
jgi:sec-independent protein translocase protein TatB